MSTEVAAGSGSAEDRLEMCSVDGRRYLRVKLGDGRSVLVSPRCPHAGTPLTEAYVVGEFLVCRRHGATFDLRTGGWVRGPKCGNIEVKAAAGDSELARA